MRLLYSVIFTLLAMTNVHAQEAIFVSKPEVIADDPGRATVEFKMENKLVSPVKGARAWVFLMGNDGKVVGNHAQWVVSKDKKNTLPAGETQTYKMAMQVQGEVTSAKVVFSRIILEDGSTPDPRKIVKALPEEKETTAN